MKKRTNLWKGLLMLGVVGVIGVACQDDEQDEVAIDDPLMEVAELSTQLSSGMDLTFTHRSGGRPEGMNFRGKPDGVGGGRPDGVGGGRPGSGFGGGQGMRFQQYNDDPNLQVISIADRIGERMSFWMFASLGVDIKHYDQSGALVEITERPERGSWSNGEGPKIAQTVIDFGDKFSIERGNVSLTLSGVITIDRVFSDDQLTETVSLQNFKLNEALVEGTKTAVRSFNEETGEGRISSTVTDGKITFNDGTSADWVSTKNRNILIEINEEGGRPLSASSTSEGETTIISSNGTILYSHKTISPIQANMSCRGRKPISGAVKTTYGENTIEVDFGNGECSNSIAITINGETVSREVGG